MAQFSRVPLEAAGFIGLMLSGALCAIVACSAGARWCPAAVSATVSTGMRMICGYIAQVAIFGHLPEWLTLFGASLMLIGVTIMSIARASEPQGSSCHGDLEAKQDASSQPVEVLSESAVSTSSEAADNDDTESLASFIAAEFAEFSPHEKPIRLRRFARSLPTAHSIGVVASLST
jgi:hypothetical protein